MNKSVRILSYLIVFFLGAALTLSVLGLPQLEIKSEQAFELSKPLTASAHVLAVSQAGEGVMGNMTVEIQPGAGRVLIDTNPFVEPDTQFSAETAIQVAENITNKNLDKSDIIVGFETPGKVVGGPSAGAAMALATIAAILDKQVREDIAITGQIYLDGSVGEISGLPEKIKAAGENGVKIFYLPASQLQMTYYEEKLVERATPSGFRYYQVYYVPKTVDLQKYADQWNMTLQGVKYIQQVVGSALVL